MQRRTLLGAGAASLLAHEAAGQQQAGGQTPVDLLLVLAIDVSRSIVESDARLQRVGYAQAFNDPQVVAAIRGGPIGAIAVAYVEWAAFDRQSLLIPWTRIGSAGDAVGWAATLQGKPWSSITWTSLSGALRFSGEVLAACPFEGTRKVIDVSGDGVNNHGPPAEPFRDRLVEQGVVINGLPIINDRPRWGEPNGAQLVPYYRESVAGGQGHFVIVAEGFDTFADAIKRKLIQEIA